VREAGESLQTGEWLSLLTLIDDVRVAIEMSELLHDLNSRSLDSRAVGSKRGIAKSAAATPLGMTELQVLGEAWHPLFGVRHHYVVQVQLRWFPCLAGGQLYLLSS
jgi:hypothetical protein